MSYLLFLDESGHDHKTMPYEVRGGIALHDRHLWTFVRALAQSEEECFGALLRDYGTEAKGSKLLNARRYKWAQQAPALPEEDRPRLARRFLEKGKSGGAPTKDEFTAYGQACLLFADRIFAALRDCSATLFATAIPRESEKPDTLEADEYLRKDSVFLLERYFYFLHEREDVGLLVMDETDDHEDRRFVRRLERYFTHTDPGRERASRIVPSPFFVSSEMTYPVQAADVCIYCVNWGFRLPDRGMNAAVRPEIREHFRHQLADLQFHTTGMKEGGHFHSYGITYVSKPYEAGKD